MSGLSPRLSAICGIEVAMMVESSWLMNMPHAITMGTAMLTPGSVSESSCEGACGGCALGIESRNSRIELDL